MKCNPQIGLAVILLLHLSSSASAQTIRTVALTGQQAPGLANGIVFDGFESVTLNALGQVAFAADLKGNNLTRFNDFGIWSESSGSLDVMVRAGDQAPGMPSGFRFGSFGYGTLSSAGQMAFYAGTEGVPTRDNRYGVWAGAKDSLRAIVKHGDPAPRTPAGVTIVLEDEMGVDVNDAGQIVMRAELEGNVVDQSNNEGILWNGGGGLEVVARMGQQVPGMPAGVNFGFMGNAAINSAGEIAFNASMMGRRADHWHDRGTWLGHPGALELVASSGAQAPGTPAGVTFDQFGWDGVVLNSAGEIAFGGSLSGTGVDDTNNNGIWAGAVGSLRLVARAGDHPLGALSGVNLQGLVDPVLNSAGRTAFFAWLSGSAVEESSNMSIWSEGWGSLQLVAREEDQAPGTATGVKFDWMSYNPMLNGAGQTAFASYLRGSELDGKGDYGLWAQDKAGALRLIVRKGERMEVVPGNVRTVQSFEYAECCAGSDEGNFSAFNARGQFAFRARFTDGSEGVFVSNVAAIPEPSSLLLASMVFLSFMPRCLRNTPYVYQLPSQLIAAKSDRK